MKPLFLPLILLSTALFAQVPSKEMVKEAAKVQAAEVKTKATDKAKDKVDAAATKVDQKASATVAKGEAKTGKTAPALASSTTLIGNKDSKSFHRADCKTAARMKEANKVPFASKAEAEKAGFKPCKVCKP